MKFKRTLRKIAKKTGRAIKKRYYTKKTGLRYKNIINDVKFLKSIVNAEKKRILLSGTGQKVGQVDGNTSGHFIVGMTPLPGQGNDYNQRSGNSIKWHSSHFNFQFFHQIGTSQGIRGTIHLIKVVGKPPPSVPSILNEYILPNSFISGALVYDENSFRNPDYFKNYIVLRKKRFYIPMDSISGQPVVKTFSFGLKLKNHHVKWSTDGSTISQGYVIMLITCDNGNASSTTASTILTGGSVGGVNTGLFFSYNISHYYYDN